MVKLLVMLQMKICCF